MLARLIFFTVATFTAISCAAVGGLLAAVIGLSAHAPAATLVAMIAGAATGGFGMAIALIGIAASLFFGPPSPPAAKS